MTDFSDGDQADLECVRRTLAGERRAFGRLVTKYQDPIFRLVYRMTGSRADAEDLAQEAFLRAYARLGSFRQDRRFHPWLYTIALNLCRNKLKRKALLRWLPLWGSGRPDDPEEAERRQPPSAERGPEEALQEAEDRRLLQAAIASLPPDYRTVLALRHSEGLSYEEIAEITGWPLGTVETRLFRARRRLADVLSKEEKSL